MASTDRDLTLRARNRSHIPAIDTTSAAPGFPAANGRGATVLLLLYFAIWTVTGRYWGLQHDAQLYAAQALEKIRPDVLSGDLFLRYTSQSDFTLFPYVFSWAINSLGLAHAAALLTLSFYALWMFLSWSLARALFGSPLAWLAVGLLVVIPGWYGADMVFRTAEPFLSARLPAEAACLGAFIALIHGRRIAAAGLVVLAAALHPIMTLPAALALAGLSTSSHESRYFWPVATACCMVGAVAGALLIGGDSALMTNAWLQLTMSRSDYLFLQNWRTQDWQVNLLPLLSVLFASQVLNGWPRRLARASFWIATCGLTLAVIAGTILPLKLLLQGQPWRWIWLAAVFSVMFLPATLLAGWRHSVSGRVVAILICAAWLLADWSSADQLPPFGIGGLLLVGSQAVWLARDRLRESHLKLIMAGASMGTGIACLGLLMSVVAVLRGEFDFGADPVWVQKTADMLEFAPLAAGLVTAAWWGTVRLWSPAHGTVVGITAAALAVAATPGAAATWMADPYSESARAAFADWRLRIPEHAEVLWPDGLTETWFLLDRRSYLTVSQLGGIVFSESLATEAHRRATLLAPLLPEGYWFLEPATTEQGTKPLTAKVFTEICRNGGPDFVVDDDNIGQQVAVIEWPTRAKFQYLYDCRDFRHGRAVTQPAPDA